mmetsp:Transcript_60783/g.121977  ORF Transcript_60783/g.121977 Transcript_60783/m.121977 type:complete len:98 (-) Transcript_60783:270-563(-)
MPPLGILHNSRFIFSQVVAEEILPHVILALFLFIFFQIAMILRDSSLEDEFDDSADDTLSRSNVGAAYVVDVALPEGPEVSTYTKARRRNKPKKGNS